MGKRIVIALGGNALGNNPEEQLELVKNTAKSIVDLIKEGHEIMIGHGNGPQVGMINLAMEYASQGGANTPAIPFPECGAMSQGYIGYHLQQAIGNELKRESIDKCCVTVVTQVVVDEHDPAFKNPTKPIGSFYTKEDAAQRIKPYANWSRKGFRLPTSNEWEWAARGGSKENYWAGTGDEKKVEDYAWIDTNSDSTTHEVAKKLPNGYGLYDMSGNVVELCWD